MTTLRTGGFIATPKAVVIIIFALMFLGLIAMLTSNVGIPMIEWAQGAVLSQLESVVSALGC